MMNQLIARRKPPHRIPISDLRAIVQTEGLLSCYLPPTNVSTGSFFAIATNTTGYVIGNGSFYDVYASTRREEVLMADHNELGYKKIFVALDGTEQQDEVFARATRIAAANEAKLYVGHVIDSTVLETAGTFPPDLIAELERSFRGSIADGVTVAEAEQAIPEVKVCVKCGRIRETLMDDMLDIIKPDLVVCGARGLSNIKYALLGSISAFLVRNAPCDVLVVK